jgi:adenylate cyclase
MRLTVARVSIGVALLVALVRLANPDALELQDTRLLDVRHRLRGERPAGNEVVIVGVDEKSIEQIGRWPWPRKEFGRLVDGLTKADAAVVGFDVLFDEPDATLDLSALESFVQKEPAAPAGALLDRVRGNVSNDALFAAAIARSKRVVLGTVFHFEGDPDPKLVEEALQLQALTAVRLANKAVALETTPFLTRPRQIGIPIKELAAAADGATGHLNYFPDLDKIYREAPLVTAVEDLLYPAFSLELIHRYLGGPVVVVVGEPGGTGGGVTRLAVGERVIPVNAHGKLGIGYLGRPKKTFASVSASDVINGVAPREMLAGKIAIVGFTATGIVDTVVTPFSSVVPGVEVHATVIDNILHGGSLWRPWWMPLGEAVLIVALGVLLGVVLHRLRGGLGALVAVVIAVGYAAGSQWAFSERGLILSAVYPMGGLFACWLAGAVYQSVSEERQKRWYRNTFRLYLNPEVTEIIASDPAKLRLGGERCPLTIFFSDIRGFTTISEKLKPEVLSELLNEYLGAMTDVVFKHQGVLDKYIGDAVMAFWGAPIHAPDHALRCSRAAMDMLDELAALRERWKPRDLPLIEIGVGVNTGEAVVGNFGSAQRFSYTAMGDDVNLASRLEGLNKQFGTTALLSDATRRAVDAEFVCREIDRVRVKGKAEAVAIHELLCRRTDARAEGELRRAAAWESALGAYRARDFETAMARLEALLSDRPDDRAVPIFLARCRVLRAEPPGPVWDAVYEATEK